jgi:amino acid adenylation domain-containing protein
MTQPLSSDEKRRLLRAQLLRKEGFAGDAPRRVPRRAGTGPAPLSFGQQRLWFLHQLDTGSAAYNISTAVRLQGDLDIPALDRALAATARRHDILRTVFPGVDGEPMQQVDGPGGTSLPRLARIDLAGLPAVARDREALRLAARGAALPFDLEHGPLLRAALLRLGPADHVLSLAMHHIVSDGWSMEILVRDLTTLYASPLGTAARLPELPIQFADYAAWQRQELQGEALESRLRWWTDRLEGAPTLLDLPLDHPRPAVQGWGGRDEPLRISSRATAALRDLAERQGATPYMLLAAALGILLQRFTGEDDLLLGTVSAGRNRPELEELIGFFVNTLVLRIDLSGDPGVPELLGRVREMSLEADARQDLPFERIVDALGLARELSHNPLFQVLLNYRSRPPALASAGPVATGPLGLSGFEVETRTAQFDLYFEVGEGPEGLEGFLRYRTDLFDASGAARLARCFEVLLAGLAEQPGRAVSELPLLTEAESRQLATAWNRPAGPMAEVTLDRLFAATAESRPAAPALSCAGRHLTYRELDERSNQLARHLRRQGIGPESRVGLRVERSAEMVIGILGILKAGGAYVPLDPDVPAERLTFLLADSGVRMLLAEVELLDPAVAAESTAPLPPSARPGNAAYVIYTSGSTGRPKGVVVTHANVTRLLAATEPWFGFSSEDVWTLFHSYAFDFSVWEIWGALAYGGRLVVVPWEVSRSPEAFLDLIAEERVTVLNQTPSAFRQLSHLEESTGPGGTRELALRHVVFGGEALELPSLAPWIARHGDERPRLINMYGITETTVHVTFRRISREDVEAGGGSVIGVPIPDLQLHVLDGHLRQVPLLAPGEICVGGAGLARGYLGRPELTAERFVPDPFGALFGQAGARLYRSGDLARRRPDGDLEYLGRRDQQVKIRGFRIETGEVQAILAAHPAVLDAVVLPWEAPEGRRLVAWVVPRPGADPSGGSFSLTDLRRHAEERLPEHMVPAVLMPLAELPLTANGKLDRRALPDPDPAAAQAETVWAPPESPAEQALATVWQEVLGVERVGALDNFFSLGGDSILSLRVLARARDLELDLTLPQLFQHQTVRELARAATATGGAGEEAAGPFALIPEEDRRRLPAEIGDAYPLAQLQAGMLFESEFGRGTAVYHDIFTVHLEAALDLPRMRQALALLAAAHPALRTSFAVTGFSEPLQLVHRTVAVPVEHEDLRGLAPDRQEERLASWIEEEKRRPFDWTRAPLLRIHVHARSDRSFQFSLGFHHAILDGWSLSTLLADLFRAYLALVAGEEPRPEPPAASSYRQFVALERQALKSAESRGYWEERLAGGTVSPLARWRPAPEPGGPRRGVHGVAFSPALSRDLLALARAENVPVKTVLLALHGRVLSALSGESRVVTGLVANGRPEEPGAERVLGLFLNTLPFRLDLSGGTWRDLLRQTFTAERELLQHRRYPMAELRRHAGGAPLFEAAFNYVHFHVQQGLAQIEGVRALGQDFFEETDFTFLANFDQNPFDQRLGLRLEYDAREFPAAQIEAVGALYERLATAMAAAPGDRWELVPVAIEEEGARRDFPSGTPLHRLFEAAAARSPSAVAVRCETRSLTYAELDALSNQLARRLRRLGVEPETRVGLCLERSPELVAALLGVLKAGGAYVPLDPDLPRERLAFLLADAGVSVLITQEELAGRLPDLPGIASVRFDAARQESAEPLSVETSAENAAYVIYTSGSTGRPKGVVVTHANVARLLAATEEWFGFSAQDVWTLFHSYAFDFSVWEIWGALAYGGRLVVVPYRVSRSPRDFLGLLEAEGVTVLNQTPSAFRQLAAAEEASPRRLALRWIVFGGEALDLPGLAPWLSRHGDEQPALVNMYGITETTVHVTFRQIRAADLADEAGSVIGRAIPDLRLRVLDRHLEPAPLFVPGEICVGGAGLARGYLGRPELTAERFMPDPRGEAGARLYRSGDLARRLPGGDLEYLGRGDRQVKIRGFRIELGEIEATLAAHPDVREAVVLPREREDGHRSLVAWVVGGPQGAPDAAGLRGFLAERLPDYMVPAVFVPLAALPLTGNGKLDRRALPDPEEARAEPGAGVHVAPEGPEEEALAAIWAGVLGVERIGRDDNFFSLGGDSILSIRILAQARERGFELDLQQIFEHPTVRQLARAARGVEEAPVPTVPFALLSAEDRRRLPEGLEDAYPLARLQAGMLFHSELDPESAMYHDITSLHVSAPYDLALLHRAVERSVARHPVLRTSFDLTGFSEPLQLVHPVVTLPITAEDLSGLDATAQEERLATWMEEEKRRPFDWTRAPLLRVQLHRRGAESFQLSLSCHHAILDGWSFSSLLTELFGAYTALLRGAVPQAGSPPNAFRDFVALEQRALESEASRRFWAERLDGATVTRLPREAAAAVLAEEPGRHVQWLPEDLSRRLHGLARSLGVPLKSLLLAAHLRALAAASGQRDVTTGLVANGRPEEEGGETALGLFLNTLPFRLALRGETWTDLVLRVFAAEREMLPHRRYPIAELQRAAGGRELVEAAFNYVHFHVFQGVESSDEAHVLTGQMFEKTNFTLLANFLQDPFTHGIEMRLEYDPDQLSPAVVAVLADRHVRALAALAAEPEARCEAEPLLTSEERGLVLGAWSGSAGPRPEVPCLHTLFEAQADRTPGAVAVVAGGTQLTYRELEERANRLARVLRGLGAELDAPVGICLERSPALPVAVLAVLKAGGACLPLDPAYPVERLALMTRDAGLSLLLTTEDLRARLPEEVLAGVRVVAIGRGGEVEGGNAERPPAGSGAADAGNLAYVLFTSGSTGRPKGVAMPHGALANLIAWQLRDTPSAARTLQFAPFSFDVCFQELFTTWATGGALFLVADELRRDAGALLALLGEQRIERLFLPFIALQQIAEAVGPWGPPPAALREVITAGEQLQITPAVAALFRALPGSRLFNQYGPTETHVTTSLTLDGEPETWPTLPPIGRPITRHRMRLLDPWLEPAPPGTPAEIFLGGAGLARGYFGRPDLTAERFLPDPFADEPGARLYRTGDLGRWRPDGEVEFLGRADGQVKIRGFRIEPGEIEAFLAGHPAVREVAVVPFGEGAGRRLVAYVVPSTESAEESEASAAGLRAHLQGRLPEHMIPAAFVRLEALPRTPSGKLDRRALPPPDIGDLRPDRPHVAPRTPTEERLAALWSESLGLERIGVHDHFFELGGHSLLATQVMARVNQAFGVTLPLRRLYEAPVLEALAIELVKAQAERADADLLARLLARVEQASPDELAAAIAGAEAGNEGEDR